MQTILGSGGAIGKELAKALCSYTQSVRLVGRNPQKVLDSDQLFPADLTDPEQTKAAVRGSEVAYLTVGLPYKTKIWAAQWPLIMKNVLDACEAHGTRLVFFDNVYSYDVTSMDPLREDQPIHPPSKKGMIRAGVLKQFHERRDAGRIRGLVARSADFYGPSIKNVSMLTETVFNPLSQGKKANWIGRIDKKHSFTYTPDAGKAVALLGNSPEAYGEDWHLPTAPDPYTGKEWITRIAESLHARPKYQVAGKGLVRLIGLFSPLMREMTEMAYQYDRDYVFNSSKFENAFGVKPTPYEEGLRHIIATDYST